MALTNVGHIIDQIQTYAGKSGTNRDAVNEKLIIDLINQKTKEWARKTKFQALKATITTADEDGDGSIDQEYELPPDVIQITKVNYDSYEAHKISFEDVDRMKGNVS